MEGLLILFEIIIVNVLLSADNAIIIAMVSAQLPINKRKNVIWWGTLVAVLLRCLLVFFALPLLQIPFLQAVGGVLLFIIAIKLLHDQQHEPQEKSNVTKNKAMTLSAGVWTIVTADFIMSLDNVLALAALAHGDFVLIMLGIAISIPMIVWGSKAVLVLLQKFSFISYIGAALLAFAAGEMVVRDDGLGPYISHLSPDLMSFIPIILIPIAIFIGVLKKKTI